MLNIRRGDNLLMTCFCGRKWEISSNKIVLVGREPMEKFTREEQTCPRSWQLECIVATDKTGVGRSFIVTAGGWEPYEGQDSYEIGIRPIRELPRSGERDEFNLIQASWTEDTVKIAAHGIAKMLEAGMLIDDIKRMFL
jgi:hypothetical protein